MLFYVCHLILMNTLGGWCHPQFTDEQKYRAQELTNLLESAQLVIKTQPKEFRILASHVHAQHNYSHNIFRVELGVYLLRIILFIYSRLKHTPTYLYR